MASPFYVLDTGILVHVIRGKGDAYESIEATYKLSLRGTRSAICIVTVGEMKSLALKFKWGATKCAALDNILAGTVRIPIDTDDVLNAYALIDHYTESAGKKMGKNDVWIAAAAKATGAILLTCDNDFDRIHPTHVTRHLVDPNTGAIKM